MKETVQFEGLVGKKGVGCLQETTDNKNPLCYNAVNVLWPAEAVTEGDIYASLHHRAQFC